jgi:hypothetical protein
MSKWKGRIARQEAIIIKYLTMLEQGDEADRWLREGFARRPARAHPSLAASSGSPLAPAN